MNPPSPNHQPPLPSLRRPLSLTIVAWLFIITGTVGLLYHGAELKAQQTFQYELAWVCLLRLLAIAGGILLLRGSIAGRWLLTLWMIYHLILSALHSLTELALHLALFAVIASLLFRPPANHYFQHRQP